MKTYKIRTGSFKITVKANHWRQALIIAFCDMPDNLGVLTEIETSGDEGKQYISTIAVLKIAGYSILDVNSLNFPESKNEN